MKSAGGKGARVLGLTCYVFRDLDGDCSAGGLSSRVNSVCLVDASGPSEPGVGCPAVRLVRRVIYGREYVHAEAVEPPPAGAARMFGGCFVWSCDSRFSAAVGHHYPVALHDRHEFSGGAS